MAASGKGIRVAAFGDPCGSWCKKVASWGPAGPFLVLCGLHLGKKSIFTPYSFRALKQVPLIIPFSGLCGLHAS